MRRYQSLTLKSQGNGRGTSWLLWLVRQATGAPSFNPRPSPGTAKLPWRPSPHALATFSSIHVSANSLRTPPPYPFITFASQVEAVAVYSQSSIPSRLSPVNIHYNTWRDATHSTPGDALSICGRSLNWHLWIERIPLITLRGQQETGVDTGLVSNPYQDYRHVAFSSICSIGAKLCCVVSKARDHHEKIFRSTRCGSSFTLRCILTSAWIHAPSVLGKTVHICFSLALK